jgi:hypothetical protein
VVLSLHLLGFWAAFAGPPPECNSTALKTSFLTAFQHFEYRDGSLGLGRADIPTREKTWKNPRQAVVNLEISDKNQLQVVSRQF